MQVDHAAILRRTVASRDTAVEEVAQERARTASVTQEKLAVEHALAHERWVSGQKSEKLNAYRGHYDGIRYHQQGVEHLLYAPDPS